METKDGFASIDEAVAELKAGRLIVVVDDEDRENEGDLMVAAEFCTPEAINFMAKFGRGLICLTLTEERADYLRLAPMVQDNSSRFGTAFTESIEAREGVTTGISAADRSRTIQVAIQPGSGPNDLARPGHIFPLRARKGGVLVRAGQTEASVDLARIAGLIPAGVICEIMNEDGTMARVPDLLGFCATHGLKMVTTAELIHYRMQNERYIRRVAEGLLPTTYGEFRAVEYESEVEGGQAHFALVMGKLGREPGDELGDGPGDGPGKAAAAQEPVLVRMQTHCLAGSVFGSALCDCRPTIDGSLRAIAQAGRGALIYLHHTQRGFGLDRSTDLGAGPKRMIFHRTGGRERGESTEQRILREVGLGGQILSDLGICRIRLLTNHPTHVPALQGFGIEIVEQVAIGSSQTAR